MTVQKPYEEPTSRPLRVYAFDPSRGRTLGNHMTIDVPYEKLDGRITGEYIEVIDYDASNECYYEPVDLNNISVAMQEGLEPSESDPRFHQQMAYAVARKTIEVFEFALGRKIKWAFNRFAKVDEKRPLRIYPHAMQEANAFYSRDLGALVFGYFPASDSDPGTNLPGQTIFTCLSHDIIAHETTHALVDGQRRYFMIPTSSDTLAFHEAFADIVALFQHFSLDEVLLDVIKKTGGRIFQSQIAPDAPPPKDGTPQIAAELPTANPLVDLARQFGEAIGQRAALRSAIGTIPDQDILDKVEEPHERGAILVAAVFDAFFTIYMRRVRDLLDIAKMVNADQIHPDIAKRLATEASKIAEHFLNICIRAIDYCPPVDIRFGDFLRALITADYDLVRDDPIGYRAALIDAFQLRGIRPHDVFSYGEKSLRWSPPEGPNGEPLVCAGLEFDLFRAMSKETGEKNARIIYKFADQNREVLGLSTKVKGISVHSFHPIHRVGPDGRIKMEAVAEVIQKIDVQVDPSDKSAGSMTYYGGVTLIIDLNPGSEGIVRYAICKYVGADPEHDERLRSQRGFAGSTSTRLSRNVYAETSDIEVPTKSGDATKSLDFSFVHRGY